MKTYQIKVNGKDYAVEVENPYASPAIVRINGKAFTVTMAEQGVPVARPVAAPAVTLEEEEIYVPETVSTYVAVAAEEAPQATEAAAAAPSSAGALQNVIAPMPGKVMDILVKVGSKVQHGDTLCNLEAMKMKSPIRSTADGTLAQVLVSEGQNVNYGDVLFALR